MQNLNNIITEIKEQATRNPFIKMVEHGDVYEIMNATRCDFPAFVFEIENATVTTNTIQYSFKLYACDLKKEEGKAKQWSLLQDILQDVTSKIQGATTTQFNYYEQKFATLCNVVEASTIIEVEKNICF